jgi:predicted GNAT family acetyltransferase
LSLRVARHPGARSFLERAEAWLCRAEDRNNLILGLAYEFAEAEEPGGPGTGPGGSETLYITVDENGGVVGCAFRSPPHQLLLTDMPAAAVTLLARELAATDPDLPAVLGPADLSEAFARAWVAEVGGHWHRGTDQRLYRLDDVTSIDAPGRLRRARAVESPIADVWAEEFSRAVHLRFGPGEERIAGWITGGALWFWEDAGAPVSMAVAHGRTPRGVRVGYVYTPPDLRRRGYAGACVSALSRHLLASGRDFCVLYADRANPTTNALYQRMGYRPLADDRDHYFFRNSSL